MLILSYAIEIHYWDIDTLLRYIIAGVTIYLMVGIFFIHYRVVSGLCSAHSWGDCCIFFISGKILIRVADGTSGITASKVRFDQQNIRPRREFHNVARIGPATPSLGEAHFLCVTFRSFFLGYFCREMSPGEIGTNEKHFLFGAATPGSPPFGVGNREGERKNRAIDRPGSTEQSEILGAR